jgi:hypothetical protein
MIATMVDGRVFKIEGDGSVMRDAGIAALKAAEDVLTARVEADALAHENCLL